MDPFIPPHKDVKPIEVDPYTAAVLLSSAKWTKTLAKLKTLALVVFSVLLLCFTSAILMGVLVLDKNRVVETMPIMIACTVIILIAVTVCFYPIRAMRKYSTLINESITSGDPIMFKSAQTYLRNLVMYLCVTAIVSIIAMVAIFAAFWLSLAQG